jgi:carbon-monoxide dehydrogenase small subunit
LVNGVPTKSCYTLALDVADAEITTIEGLRDTPVQEAFVAEYGFQCGFCTPGFVMNATALLERGGGLDSDENREWLESNICRCTGYETIERAVRRAAGGELPPTGTGPGD